MRIGGAFALLVVGLILGLRVVVLPHALTQYLDTEKLGWIMVLCGVLFIALALYANWQATHQRTTYVERSHPDDRRWP